MGYSTNYELTMEPWRKEIDEAISQEKDMDYAVGEYKQECKWYDHDKDMISFSKRFPDVLFTLEGQGEESGDLWNTYYKNGRMQHCTAIITYEEFDESKLK